MTEQQKQQHQLAARREELRMAAYAIARAIIEGRDGTPETWALLVQLGVDIRKIDAAARAA